MCMGPGSIIQPPAQGIPGEKKFGLTIGERVEIVEDAHFKGWHGHVRVFDSSLVAVDLDEPPPGHQQNGQWFKPEEVRSAPLE